MNSRASNVELVHQLLAGGVPDAAGMHAFAAQWLDSSVTLDYPGSPPIPYAGCWRGWKGFADFMSVFHDAVETQRLDILSVDGGGADVVFVRGMTRGKVRRTGKSYTSNWLLIWTLKEGKVMQMVEYHDTQAIANAFT